ncbi:hypothetical protein EB796_002092 [Bugula neritina]|uniref:Uncharacterized protein n=1 Tax=Bugula neritina TaxID=10212 RepID=A0A7J7KN61_BUGNE|nr:hypothetical protein EB796_002092 [Bugula neritina]
MIELCVEQRCGISNNALVTTFNNTRIRLFIEDYKNTSQSQSRYIKTTKFFSFILGTKIIPSKHLKTPKLIKLTYVIYLFIEDYFTITPQQSLLL